MKDMTQGSPLKIILRFTIPILLGNLLQLTYSIADTRIVGTFLGDQALAAVGATTVLTTLYTGLFMGFSNGFAIMTARKFGGGELKRVRLSFISALLMGFVLSLGVVLLTLLAMNPILHFLNVPENLFKVSGDYIRIVVAGMIVTMIYDVLLASARAIGDSVTPLLTLILSVGMNVVGDLLMLGYFHTGVWGAAAATVVSQAITLVICAIYLLRKYDFFRPRKGDLGELDPAMAKSMFLTALSMGFMNSLVSIGSLILQTAINGLGDTYIVAQTAARKITEVLMVVFSSVGYTMATYCSQNLGAGKKDRIIKGVRAGYQITCGWCVIVLLIAYFLSPILVQMITGSNNQEMIDAAAKYLKIDTILYVVVAVISTSRNSLQGIGDRITPLISSGIELVGKAILTATIVPAMGYNGVILVEPIVWVVMVIPLVVRMRQWEKS